jgi:hypothetical protein
MLLKLVLSHEGCVRQQGLKACAKLRHKEGEGGGNLLQTKTPERQEEEEKSNGYH